MILWKSLSMPNFLFFIKFMPALSSKNGNLWKICIFQICDVMHFKKSAKIQTATIFFNIWIFHHYFWHFCKSYEHFQAKFSILFYYDITYIKKPIWQGSNNDNLWDNWYFFVKKIWTLQFLSYIDILYTIRSQIEGFNPLGQPFLRKNGKM